MKSNEAAFGIAAISITAEREKELDLSQPMFDAGLQILTPVKGHRGGLSHGDHRRRTLFDGLADSRDRLADHRGHRAPGLVLRETQSEPACWRTRRTFQAFSRPAGGRPRRWPRRRTRCHAAHSQESLQSSGCSRVWCSSPISRHRSPRRSRCSNCEGTSTGPRILPGKRVASVRGSTSVEYLKQHPIGATEFPKVEDALEALQQGQADAVVYDAPVLLYYASHEGNGKVQPAGAIFRKENYGIVFPSDSRYRKPVNEALLEDQGSWHLRPLVPEVVRWKRPVESPSGEFAFDVRWRPCQIPAYQA